LNQPPIQKKKGRLAASIPVVPSRLRVSLLATLVAVLAIGNGHRIWTNHAPGCPTYTSVPGVDLIAHAAGGLPGRMYPNNIEALDHSYANGFRTFEMDFHRLPFGLMRTGHDPIDMFDPRGAWLWQILGWFRHHPGTRLIVDMKTNNIEGLKTIAAAAPDLRNRITPFVYTNHNYEAVRKLGLSLPIYALFNRDDPDWLAFANSHDFAAVALSASKIPEIQKVRHPVIAFTYDAVTDAPGARVFITNCMIPARNK
jgi:hypothetical protein